MLTELILRNFRTVVHDLEHILYFVRNRFPPPFALNYAEINSLPQPVEERSRTIEEVLKDTFLWAVQKKRASLERRKKRKYGQITQFYKLIIPKTDIVICVHCGNDYERNHLCKYCYTQVQNETKEMQDAIQKELGLSPVEQEVVVLYEGEKESRSSEFWEGKRIVELPKERPAWFSKNLLQRSTQTTVPNTEVKPENLA